MPGGFRDTTIRGWARALFEAPAIEQVSGKAKRRDPASNHDSADRHARHSNRCRSHCEPGATRRQHSRRHPRQPKRLAVHKVLPQLRHSSVAGAAICRKSRPHARGRSGGRAAGVAGLTASMSCPGNHNWRSHRVAPRRVYFSGTAPSRAVPTLPRHICGGAFLFSRNPPPFPSLYWQSIGFPCLMPDARMGLHSAKHGFRRGWITMQYGE